MKRRSHRLPPVAIAIAALIAFSGCDGCCGARSPPQSCSVGCTSFGRNECSFFCPDASRPDPIYEKDASSHDASVRVVIATLKGEPHGLATIGESVYVIDGDRLLQVVFGPPQPTPTDGGSDASDASLDADTDGEADADLDADLDATDAPQEKTIIAIDLGDPRGLVSYDGFLYWTRLQGGTTQGAIARMQVEPVRGSVEILSHATWPLEGVVIDDAGVRWLEDMNGLLRTDGDGGSSLLASAPITPTNSFRPLARANGITSFIAQNTLVMLDDDGGWTSVSAPSAVAIVSTDGGPMIALANGDIATLADGGLTTHKGTGAVRAMITDGTDLYIADDARNVIRKVSSNGVSTVLDASGNVPHDIALTKNALYYTTRPDNSPGQVIRIPR